MPVKSYDCGLVNSFFNLFQFNLIPQADSLQCDIRILLLNLAIEIHLPFPKETVTRASWTGRLTRHFTSYLLLVNTVTLVNN